MKNRKNDCLRSGPSGIVFNLRFINADKVEFHVRKVNPKDHDIVQLYNLFSFSFFFFLF